MVSVSNTKILCCCVLLLFAFGCRKESANPMEIRSVITRFYAQPQVGEGPAEDTNLMSVNLKKQLHAASEITRQDEIRIQNSESPTDKPLLIEGAVFSGLYDGYSQFRIGTITVKKDKAEVLMHFELGPEFKEDWVDTVELISEKGWKIDNVRFANKVSVFKDLKEKLDLTSGNR